MVLSSATNELVFADASPDAQRIQAVKVTNGRVRDIVTNVYPTAVAVDDDNRYVGLKGFVGENLKDLKVELLSHISTPSVDTDE